MGAFEYRKGDLYCEGLRVADVIQEVGTPCYLYSHKALVDNYQMFDEAFTSVKHMVCYAVKTNANLCILRTLARLGAGADIVSAGELYRALTAGFRPEKIVFAGVGKTEDEIYMLSKELVNKYKDQKYLLAAGCEISVLTPHQNLMAMRRASYLSPVC